MSLHFSRLKIYPILFALLTAFPPLSTAAQAQVSPFTQSLAEAASEDEAISSFYRDRAYQPLWTGAADAERRNALLNALSRAADHGLPVPRYDANALIAAFRSARTEGDVGRLEVRMTRAFLDYARDIHTGALVPSEIDHGIVREVAIVDRRANLDAFVAANPVDFLRSLPPSDPAYAALMKAKLHIESQIAKGGWGPQIPAIALSPGQSGEAVVALRNRLIAMGYLGRTATQDYDSAIIKAVQSFQLDHGLTADGAANEATIAEVNLPPQDRLKSIIVGMERVRWLDIDRSNRYIWVNLPDFTAKIIDNGKVTFSTRSVIGKNDGDTQSPEFSDMMELMVINPSWSVPRSITTKEYLPLLKRNPNAAGHLRILDRKGRLVNRGAINFAQYTAANFPYSMQQAPSDGNALGKVKFLFPNKYNIYLHDTPTKQLFDREVRAFSHGCIRLGDPFEFAYTLLAKQTADPQAEFARYLDTGREAGVRLEQQVPVHLVYFTAYPTARGDISYRRDVYGRDARIFDALSEAGVVLHGVQG